MKTKVFTFIKITITLLLFYFIFRDIDFITFGSTLRNARPEILLTGFIVLWIGHYICIFRWRMLMRPLMPVPSLNRLFGIYCIGLFFNLTFPTVVGGDIVKIYYAGKHSNSYAQSFAAAFLDRDTGMLAMLVIACIATLFYAVSVPGIPVLSIIWIAFAVFILGNICLFTPNLHHLMTNLLQRMHLAKIANKVDRVSNVFLIIGKHPSILLGSMAISFINQFLYISFVWFISLGLRLNVPFYNFLIFVPVITLISMIPISLNGMGLRETAFMSLFGTIGVIPASCLALGLVVSIITILSSLPGGIVYILFKDHVDQQQLSALETEFS